MTQANKPYHLPNQHLGYRPSIFYLSLYLLVIILSQLIFSNLLNPLSRRASPALTPSGYRTYASSEDGISFEYPASWAVSSSPSGIDISEPHSDHFINIKIVKGQSNPEKLVSDWEKSPFYKVNPDSSIKIGNLKTLELLDDSSNANHSQYLLYALRNSTIYEVAFIASDSSRTAAVAKLLSSIKFSPTPTPVPTSSFCGGIAGISCPAGYKCKLDGTYPDAGGTCLPSRN